MKKSRAGTRGTMKTKWSPYNGTDNLLGFRWQIQTMLTVIQKTS